MFFWKVPHQDEAKQVDANLADKAVNMFKMKRASNKRKEELNHTVLAQT